MKTREELDENGFGDVLIIDQDFTIPAIIGVDAHTEEQSMIMINW